MGNCLKPQSSRKYDYDWSSPETEINGGSWGKMGGGESGKIREVKIKMKKKQLEKVLGKIEVKDMRVDEVLAQLLRHGGQGYEYEVHQHQQPWRPALQSIPEVN